MQGSWSQPGLGGRSALNAGEHARFAHRALHVRASSKVYSRVYDSRRLRLLEKQYYFWALDPLWRDGRVEEQHRDSMGRPSLPPSIPLLLPHHARPTRIPRYTYVLEAQTREGCGSYSGRSREPRPEKKSRNKGGWKDALAPPPSSLALIL